MNYAKIIDGALKLFPKKIKVTFIHAVTGELIGKFKLPPELLPARFNKPITIEANGRLWRVLQASPVDANDFLFTKKLTLHVQENELVDTTSVRLSVPTSAWPAPEFSTDCLFHDFVLDLPPDQWRQIEFLPAAMLPVIQQEMAAIEPILFPANGDNRLLGYENNHIRKDIGCHNNAIAFDDFYSLVNGREKGALCFSGYSGEYILHGFAFHSDNYIYYGTVQGNFIRDLCIQQFDCIDDEIYSSLTHFKMVLVNWCEGSIISGEDMVINEEAAQQPLTDQTSEIF